MKFFGCGSSSSGGDKFRGRNEFHRPASPSNTPAKPVATARVNKLASRSHHSLRSSRTGCRWNCPEAESGKSSCASCRKQLRL